MELILTDEQLKRADRSASEETGIPSIVLMERAAVAVTDFIMEGNFDLSDVVVICGTGNNGGDGAAIARMLCERGAGVRLFVAGKKEKFTEQMQLQIRILGHYPVPVKEIAAASDLPDSASLIVDAIFGIGIRRKVDGLFADVINAINQYTSPVISVDMPSGVHTNSGAVYGTAVRADYTVTFTTAKAGLYLQPGADYAGRIVIRKIGIPVSREMEEECRLMNLTDDDLEHLPARDEWGNKGTFGKVLIIAGSEKIAGAAFLSAKAALLCGIGMVKIYTHEANRTILSTLLPEALITTYGDDDWTPSSLDKDLEWADAVLIGPGLGTEALSMKILKHFMKTNHTLPTVFDADALNMISMKPDLLSDIDFPASATPHPGEMSRLTGISISDIRSNLIDVARRTAMDMKRTIILKDRRTVTACPDGKCYLNLSGCSALATAGSGDVLAGMVTAFTCLYRNSSLPVCPEALAVFIHGRCGERAAGKYSESSVKASDLFEFIHEYLP